MSVETPLELIMDRLRPLVRSAIADTQMHNNKSVCIEVNLRSGSSNAEIKYGVETALPILNLDTGEESPPRNIQRKDTYDRAIARIEIDVKTLLLERWRLQSKTTVVLRIREGAYMSCEPSGSEPRYFAEDKVARKTGVTVGKHKVAVR